MHIPLTVPTAVDAVVEPEVAVEAVVVPVVVVVPACNLLLLLLVVAAYTSPRRTTSSGPPPPATCLSSRAHVICAEHTKAVIAANLRIAIIYGLSGIIMGCVG